MIIKARLQNMHEKYSKWISSHAYIENMKFKKIKNKVIRHIGVEYTKSNGWPIHVYVEGPSLK